MSRRIYSIIPNLAEYLRTVFPDYTFVNDGFLEGMGSDVVAVVDNGGETRPYYDRIDVAVQVLARGVSRPGTGRRIAEVADHLRGRFGGQVLPEVIVEGVTYPEVITAAIIAQTKAGYIGIDENRLHMWSANFTVTVGG